MIFTTEQFPKPNGHGVYPHEAAEAISFNSKKSRAEIRVLKLEQGWISAEESHHQQGNYAGFSSPLSAHKFFPTRELAIKNAAEIIILHQEQIVNRPCGMTTEN